MAGYPAPESLAGKVRALERRLAALEGGTRAGRTAIRNGLLVILDDNDDIVLSAGKQPDGAVSLRVFDPVTGDAQVTVGELTDGSYGIEQIDSAGDTVSLSAVALGTRAETLFGPFTTSSAPADIGGPEVVVTVPSTGRVSIEVSVQALVDAGVTLAQAYIRIDGAGAGRAIARCSNPSGSAQDLSLAAVEAVTGLSPGDHTFTMEHGSTAGSTSFYYSSLIVRPY